MSTLKVTVIGGVIVLIVGAFVIEPLKKMLFGEPARSSQAAVTQTIDQTNQKPVIHDIPTDEKKESSTVSDNIFVIQSYSTIETYNGDLNVTMNCTVKYVNQDIDITISQKGKKAKSYKGLSLGHKVKYEGYEITFYNLKSNISTFDVLLKIERIV